MSKKREKTHHLDIGEARWPETATVDGVLYRLHRMTTAPTMGVYEKVKDQYPNWEDFLTWNADFKMMLERTQHFMMQYEAEDGSRITMSRYPLASYQYHKCRCGKMLVGQEPTPEEKAEGDRFVFRCYACNRSIHSKEPGWREKQRRDTDE